MTWTLWGVDSDASKTGEGVAGPATAEEPGRVRVPEAQKFELALLEQSGVGVAQSGGEVGVSGSRGSRVQAAKGDIAASLVRNDWSLAQLLEADDDKLAKLVWRNAYLNPRDQEVAYADPEWRKSILQPVLEDVGVYRALQRQREETQWVEMEAEVKAGRVEVFRCKPDEGNPKLAAAKKLMASLYSDDSERGDKMLKRFIEHSPRLWIASRDVDVFYHYGDSFYGAAYAQLPKTSRVLQMELEQREHCAAKLVGLFLALSALQDAEATQLLSGMAEHPPKKL